MIAKREVVKKRLLDTFDYLQRQGLNSDEVTSIVNDVLQIRPKEVVKVPIHIFDNENLSSLETIVKYLRENLLLGFVQIASLTNRNNVALAVTYRNAKRKMSAKFVEGVSPYYIPVSILQDRKLSVLENIVSYLKDSFELSYHSIAILLNRDDRTIWTVYQRARIKKEAKQK